MHRCVESIGMCAALGPHSTEPGTRPKLFYGFPRERGATARTTLAFMEAMWKTRPGQIAPGLRGNKGASQTDIVPSRQRSTHRTSEEKRLHRGYDYRHGHQMSPSPKRRPSAFPTNLENDTEVGLTPHEPPGPSRSAPHRAGWLAHWWHELIRAWSVQGSSRAVRRETREGEAHREDASMGRPEAGKGRAAGTYQAVPYHTGLRLVQALFHSYRSRYHAVPGSGITTARGGFQHRRLIARHSRRSFHQPTARLAFAYPSTLVGRGPNASSLEGVPCAGSSKLLECSVEENRARARCKGKSFACQSRRSKRTEGRKNRIEQQQEKKQRKQSIAAASASVGNSPRMRRQLRA